MLFQLYFGVIKFEQLAILNGVNNNNLWYVFYVLIGVTVPLMINFAIQKIKIFLIKHSTLHNIIKK